MAEHPRDELRRRIAEALRDDPDGDTAADAIVKLFQVRERHQDLDVTAFGDQREQIWRQRWIVAELAREGEPERIEGAWRG
jgi:hypothetical protein